MLSNHILFRQQDPDRFRISVVHTSTASIRFWIVSKGETVPSMGIGEKATYLPVTLFDSSEILKVSGREVEFGQGSVEPCDFGLDLAQFADSVRSEDESVVYLLATSSRRISQAKARTALRLTAAELSKKHGVPADRIKTAYVGAKKKRKCNCGSSPKAVRLPNSAKGRCGSPTPILT